MSQHTLTLLRFTYKKLKEKLTVSDSKKLFHEQFPYVIPGLYKKIVDEILVELNLLNHQNEFKQDDLFCVGLTETFKEFTKGYSPDTHLDLLFESLCSSTNFEAKEIKEISQKSQKEFSDKSSKDIFKLLKEKSNAKLYPSRILNLGIYILISNSKDFKEKNEIEINNKISEKSQKEFENKSFNDTLKILKEKSNSKLYSSRILNLGIYIIISNSPDFKGGNESDTNKIIPDIFEKLNLSINKAEKDIGIYKSTISKMEQAKELIEELKIKDKKKDKNK